MLIRGLRNLRKIKDLCRSYIQPKDLVLINNKWYKNQGILNLGRTIRVEFNNEKGYKTFTIKKYVQKYFNFGISG